MRHEHCSRSPFIRVCGNLMCIYFESIDDAKINVSRAMHVHRQGL